MAKNRNNYIANIKKPPFKDSNKEEVVEQMSQEDEKTQTKETLVKEQETSSEKETVSSKPETNASVTPSEQKETKPNPTPVQKETKPSPQTTTQPAQKGFSPVYKVEFALTNYMEAMDITKTIVPADGGRWQYSLYTTIKDVLNAPTQQEFNKEWNTILNFFNKNKVPQLTENFIFRFAAEWPGSPNEWKTFQRVVYVIVNTADPTTRRKNILDINLDLVTEHMSREESTKFLNFYG